VGEQLVVDANVIAKLYLRDEQYIANADILFTKFQQGEVELVAPRLVTYEVPAAMKKAIAQARVGEQTGHDAIRSLEQLGLVIIDDSEAKHEAFRLAINYGCTYYDAIYLLLAEDLDCPFITADDKLWRPLHHSLPYIVRLASYS